MGGQPKTPIDASMVYALTALFIAVDGNDPTCECSTAHWAIWAIQHVRRVGTVLLRPLTSAIRGHD